jgi:hypothetical protein
MLIRVSLNSEEVGLAKELTLFADDLCYNGVLGLGWRKAELGNMFGKGKDTEGDNDFMIL